MAKQKHQVNKPGQFKLAGRERPGKDTVPELNKQAYRQGEKREKVVTVKPMPKRKRT